LSLVYELPGLGLYALIERSAYNEGITGTLFTSACMFTKLEIGYLGLTPRAVRRIYMSDTSIPMLRETQAENKFRRNSS